MLCAHQRPYTGCAHRHFLHHRKQTHFWESNLWHLHLAGVPVEMLTHYTNPPRMFMNIVTLRALSACRVRMELKSAVHVLRRIRAYVWIESHVKVLFYFLGVGSSFDGPTSEQAWRPVICRNRLPLSPFLLWLRKQVE